MKIDHRLDLRDAFRRETSRSIRVLRRTPAFSLMTLVTLAVGLGATTVVYTVFDAVVMRPLPYRNAQELVSILHHVTAPGSGERRWGLSTGGYVHFRKNARTLSNIGMYRTFGLTINGGGEAAVVRAALVTSSVFDVLGARASRGRLIAPSDDLPDSTKRVVIGYEFWKRRFGSDPDIVGRMLETNTGPYEIIGVTQPRFSLPLPGPFSSSAALAGVPQDVWLPMKVNPTGPHFNIHPNVGVGRLRPGRTAAEAHREIQALTRQFPEVVPNAYPAGFIEQYHLRGEVVPLKDAVLGPFLPRTMWMLFGAVLLVMLIAAANVAGLFIVRQESRRREVAIRAAMGADRWHMAGHYLSESLIPCAVAAVAGTCLAFAGLRAVRVIAPTDIPRLADASIGWQSALFAAGVALVAGLVFGLVPLARATRLDGLRADGRGLTTSRTRRSVHDVLVVGQMATAVVLLTSAGLMTRSFSRLRDVQPGFDHRQVLAFDVSVPFPAYDTREKATAFHRAVQDQLAGIPGVVSVSSITTLPLEGYGRWCSVVWREKRPYEPGEHPPCVSTPIAGPGFFETLRIPVRGRTPTWDDVDRGSNVTVVTQALADRLWPGEDPIGQGINMYGSNSPNWFRVIGVVPQLRAEALDLPRSEAVFFPPTGFNAGERTNAVNFLTYLIRTDGVDPRSVIPTARALLAAANPRIPFANVRTMDEVFDRSMSRTSFLMILLAMAATVALALSAVGTFGVISYLVTQRRPEIGVRIALGASVRSVSRLVLLQSLRLASLGVAIGTALALATTRLLSRLLFDVSPTDPGVLLTVGAALLGVAALAAFAPARRAARIDPVEVLRAG